MVLRRCRRLLGDEQAALDAMQDTFVQVLRREDRLDGAAPSSLLWRAGLSVSGVRKRLRTRGHSHELGLLPGGGRLPDAELRSSLSGLEVDVRIAILDSCASGALIRSKGGRRRAPFVLDESAEVRGHAYLTSSSADEVAQESDRIGASYFTHHLVTGLRGAADVDKDHRVTLSGAYQYAFHATLERAQKSLKGPQHPNYDFEVAGSRDVVITDLSDAGSRLVLDRGAGGRFVVCDAQARLVAELDKVPGRSTELGLEPGRHRVELRAESGAYAAEVELREGQATRVDVASMRRVTMTASRDRGGAPAAVREAPGPEQVPMNIGIVPGISIRGFDKHVTQLSLNIIGGINAQVDGLELGGFVNITSGNVRATQIAGSTNIVGGDVRGLQLAGAFNLAGGDVQAMTR